MTRAPGKRREDAHSGQPQPVVDLAATEHARPEHQVRLPGGDRAEDGRKLGRVPLAVAVHRHDEAGSVLAGELIADAQRHAVPAVALEPGHPRPRGSGDLGGAVGTAVVDHERRRRQGAGVCGDGADDVADRLRLVERRDHHGDRRQRHARRIGSEPRDRLGACDRDVRRQASRRVRAAIVSADHRLCAQLPDPRARSLGRGDPR